MVRANFSCNGDEDCLSMCHSEEHVGLCQNFAAVTCHREAYNTCITYPIDANAVFIAPENTVRLADGPNAYSGRVEVYANGTWGTVCDDHWNLNAGSVVCEQLGFAKVTSIHEAAEFGPGNNIVFNSFK